MAVLKKIKRAFRGDVDFTTLVCEAVRRSVNFVVERKERTIVANNRKQPAVLCERYSQMRPDELLRYYRGDREPNFLKGFHHRVNADLHRELFPAQTQKLIVSADSIVNDHCWTLMGFGEKAFGGEIQWTRDLLSGYGWPLDFHRDIKLVRSDGSDIRVLWELNRLGHFITLARAYALTNDERYSAEFFLNSEAGTSRILTAVVLTGRAQWKSLFV